MNTTSIKKQKILRLSLTYLLLTLSVIVIIYPLLWAVGASFNPGNSLVSTSLIPANPTLGHYQKLFAGDNSLYYVQWYWNSLKIGVMTMFLSLIFVSMTAYSFSRFRFAGRNWICAH